MRPTPPFGGQFQDQDMTKKDPPKAKPVALDASQEEGTKKKKAGRTKTGTSPTQEAILKAALQEFSDKGFDGARVDEIALRSGAQKYLIYYYFKSKDGLFLAVLEHMYATLRKRQKDLSIRDMDPMEGMKKLIVFTARVWLQHPEFLNLLSSENLLGGRHVKGSTALPALYNPLLDTIRTLLDRGVALGVFRADIDVVDLYISITALPAYYFDRRHTLGAIFGDKLMSPARVKQRIDHSVDMILRYLKA
jgi:TetR/AcrR family transcriptional regulator